MCAYSEMTRISLLWSRHSWVMTDVTDLWLKLKYLGGGEGKGRDKREKRGKEGERREEMIQEKVGREGGH